MRTTSIYETADRLIGEIKSRAPYKQTRSERVDAVSPIRRTQQLNVEWKIDWRKRFSTAIL